MRRDYEWKKTFSVAAALQSCHPDNILDLSARSSFLPAWYRSKSNVSSNKGKSRLSPVRRPWPLCTGWKLCNKPTVIQVNSDGTILDKITNLMWQRQDDSITRTCLKQIIMPKPEPWRIYRLAAAVEKWMTPALSITGRRILRLTALHSQTQKASTYWSSTTDDLLFTVSHG